MWYDILKDIPSHTTFISGAKPKGKINTKPMEDFFVKRLTHKIKTTKNLPHIISGGLAKDYWNDVVKPRLDAGEELEDAYSMKEYFSYAIKKVLGVGE